MGVKAKADLLQTDQRSLFAFKARLRTVPHLTNKNKIMQSTMQDTDRSQEINTS